MAGETPRVGVGTMETMSGAHVARRSPVWEERSAWRDYLALAKPAITLFIVLVGVAGYLLASPGTIVLRPFVLLIACGASASAGAAMLNHYLDRDVDAQMRRTRHRPLPAHRIARGYRVAVLGLVFSGIGVGVATWAINWLAGVAILSGGFTYVVIYTYLLKRRSSWNIVIGGFAGSAPALAGSAAAVGHITPGVWAFALLVFLWTPPHFWSLALLLKDDYREAGLPMLPRMNDLKFSGRMVLLSAALLVPATVLVGLLGPVNEAVFIALLALAAGFVVVTLPLATSVGSRPAKRAFLYSAMYLLFVVVALGANSVIAGVRPF
ncbi:MAG: heme o synthase [Thermoplasmata archaeon]